MGEWGWKSDMIIMKSYCFVADFFLLSIPILRFERFVVYQDYSFYILLQSSRSSSHFATQGKGHGINQPSGVLNTSFHFSSQANGM